MDAPPQQRLALPQVTLVSATSVNLDATVSALAKSMAQVDFGAVRLLSDRRPAHLPLGAEWVPIAPLQSAAAYSDFMLTQLFDHVTTSHALIMQWDGHVIDASRWLPVFLDYDYIGASWPQFSDGYDVGNGGFSLRSRVLLDACRKPGFRPSHPEDLAIGRHNRAYLEALGLRIAPQALADLFSAERGGNTATSFGYHGVWHMPYLLGRNAFWQIYLGLDERSSIRNDFSVILREVIRGPGGAGRAWRLIRDRIGDAFSHRREMP